MSDSKSEIRRRIRDLRKAVVAIQPATMRALMFRHPPLALQDHIPSDAIISIYSAIGDEAPTDAYAAFFAEAGHSIARPWFADKNSDMQFALTRDPIGNTDLQPGPWATMQTSPSSKKVTPNVHFVPLVAFTDDGGRLGQGGGHYDRWFAANRGDIPNLQIFGLAWDEQLVPTLPMEPHDVPMNAVITPTRLYGPFQ